MTKEPERGPSEGAPEEVVEVPPEALGDDVKRALVEEFVTRDGTDYGAVEKSLAEKVANVLGQLERGEARILYDEATGRTHIALA